MIGSLRVLGLLSSQGQIQTGSTTCIILSTFEVHTVLSEYGDFIFLCTLLIAIIWSLIHLPAQDHKTA
jgi:hypothetical protein